MIERAEVHAILPHRVDGARVSSKGPLGAHYRVWGDGKQMVKADRFDYFGLTGHTANKSSELIARNIPSAASMCYDAGANQLVIPMNANNGLAFVRIE